ncbi:WhiB family redox-sensing transcriptional regulator [Pseudonocardia sediminis]|uniref:Transcriptional regulator WhiB n=1 Tax=Pseudonocardia sediminis TaxID=1397368 RepID=A0A4Q7UXW3_PSEST|nr:WhiB family transcriptional regulator [Pseudonocardia sediminis]RZT86927.1 WhiB family redox-sensing transcriptional regulator [Pseudonocardia sediminis]
MADVRRLPVPVTSTWDWQMRAACRGAGDELFFHPALERGPDAVARDDAAKRICAVCPVIEECLAHAMAVQEPYGVWGGMTTGEREAVFLYDRHRARRAGTRPDPTPQSPTG